MIALFIIFSIVISVFSLHMMHRKTHRLNYTYNYNYTYQSFNLCTQVHVASTQTKFCRSYAEHIKVRAGLLCGDLSAHVRKTPGQTRLLIPYVCICPVLRPHSAEGKAVPVILQYHQLTSL